MKIIILLGIILLGTLILRTVIGAIEMFLFEDTKLVSEVTKKSKWYPYLKIWNAIEVIIEVIVYIILVINYY